MTSSQAFRKVTIDHNSIVALDKRTSGDALTAKDNEIATAMDGILALASQGSVGIVLPAIAASERQQQGNVVRDFTTFRNRIAALGITPEQYSLPEMRLGVTFLGYATLGFVGPEWNVLQRELQQIIHPNMDWDDTSHKNWLNRCCDVMTIFAHFQANADLFVTDDKKAFLSHNKKIKLLQLGANMIEPADQAYHLLSTGVVPKAAPLDLPRFDNSPEKRCTYIPPNCYEHYREFRRSKGLPAL